MIQLVKNRNLTHTKNMTGKAINKENDGLIAILKEISDLAILKNEGWYRIPVKSTPNRWPPEWMAFYQPKIFGDDAYQIKYYGNVQDIRRVKRFDLFPNEISSIKAEQQYFQVFIDELLERPTPIYSVRQRRLVFIPTTWQKFLNAAILNDLFDDSPLEEKLWLELKNRNIDAERQWRVIIANRIYYLDFAVFCNNGQINIETDGDTYHLERFRVSRDNARDNALQIQNWKILRFNTKQLTTQFENECLCDIQDAINSLGGLKVDNIVPRIFYNNGNRHSQQMTLFEKTLQGYQLYCEEESDFELENY